MSKIHKDQTLVQTIPTHYDSAGKEGSYLNHLAYIL
jgi:hypothetical protein